MVCSMMNFTLNYNRVSAVIYINYIRKEKIVLARPKF
jgi:hypothetical protein